MSDTPAAVAELQRRLVMHRSAAERLKMGCAMFDAARSLMLAGLGNPDSSPAVRVRLFERTYGSDFDSVTAVRIAARLRDAVG